MEAYGIQEINFKSIMTWKDLYANTVLSGDINTRYALK